jgi:hypothetical protein
VTKIFRRLLGACALTAVTLAAAPSARAATFTPNQTSKNILISGEIVTGDYEKFKALINWMQKTWGFGPERLFLNSGGGSQLVGMQIGEIVREKGLDIFVPGEAICLSSCVTIFAAGKLRAVTPEAKIGVHSVFFTDQSKGKPTSGKEIEATSGTLALIRLYKKWGVPDAILIKLATTKPEDITYLTVEDYPSWGVNRILPNVKPVTPSALQTP